MFFACCIQVGELKAEKSIPDSILREARGLAIITEVKFGMMLTYKIGTGLVVARRADGSWSPPSAISTCGLGYGVQVIFSPSCVFVITKAFLTLETFVCILYLSGWRGVG
jgi:lipid-binding SYLF domain-containing protein